MNIALLPLDNRPVSYLLPKQIADFSGLNLFLPERKYLGDLKHGSKLAYIEKWLKELDKIDSLIVSLDNIVYGGLIQSRKHNFTMDELKSHVNLFENCCRDIPQNTSVYGLSSILRIPDYNSDEEEKGYWKDYGKKIFNWSKLMHTHKELLEKWYQSSKEIPPEILSDYKNHRDKNLAINLIWLEFLHKQIFKYLIFSEDDSSKYGINVIEAEYLKQQISAHNFINKAKVISGTDEIPLVLMTKTYLEKQKLYPKISLYFNSAGGKNHIARYESDTIYSSVKNQLDVINLDAKDSIKNGSDIILCVHCADSVQGDHIFGERPSDTKGNTGELTAFLEKIKKPFIIADLAYANGADPVLIERLLNSKINWDLCYSYAGWNTCSNTIGSALAIGIHRWLSGRNNTFNKILFKKCLLSRFLDDYVYQTQIRHLNITKEEINKKIQSYVKCFSNLLGLNDININCSLPWNRSFEVEIEINK